jgi:hypothetical protein
VAGGAQTEDYGNYADSVTPNTASESSSSDDEPDNEDEASAEDEPVNNAQKSEVASEA